MSIPSLCPWKSGDDVGIGWCDVVEESRSDNLGKYLDLILKYVLHVTLLHLIRHILIRLSCSTQNHLTFAYNSNTSTLLSIFDWDQQKWSVRNRQHRIMSCRPYQSTLKVNFSSNRQACIVQQCLEGDDELQPNRIDKTFQVDGSCLLMYVFVLFWNHKGFMLTQRPFSNAEFY